MIFNNTMKTLLNIGYIIWYKMHITWLRVIEVEILIPMNPMSTPSQIDQNDDLVNDYIDSWDGDDVAKMLGHMDEDGSYIKEPKHKPYDGPYCETP